MRICYSMYVCMYTLTYTSIYIYIYIYTHTYILTYREREREMHASQASNDIQDATIRDRQTNRGWALTLHPKP